MDIHKPKSWHGVREFLKEYVIIVVGVLTALAAEAGVEWLHWRHQVELAREALAFDMKRVMAWAGAIDVQTPCIGERLAEIDRILDRAEATGRLPALGDLPSIGQGGWVMRSWSTLTYGQTLAHMTHREQLSLSAMALQVEALHEAGPKLQAAWSALRSLSGPGRPIERQEIATLRATVSTARDVAMNLRRGATRTETFVIQTGLLPRAQWEPAWREGVDGTEGGRPFRRALCQPIPSQFMGRDLRTAQALAAPLTRPGEAQMDDLGVRGERLK